MLLWNKSRITDLAILVGYKFKTEKKSSRLNKSVIKSNGPYHNLGINLIFTRL